MHFDQCELPSGPGDHLESFGISEKQFSMAIQGSGLVAQSLVCTTEVEFNGTLVLLVELLSAISFVVSGATFLMMEVLAGRSFKLNIETAWPQDLSTKFSAKYFSYSSLSSIIIFK